MQEDENPRKGLFERMFAGNPRAAGEDKVREYIVHRIRHGASLKEILQEEYVQRSCNQDELDEVVRDPRLIHEEREELERFFEDGRLDPTLARRRR